MGYFRALRLEQAGDPHHLSGWQVISELTRRVDMTWEQRATCGTLREGVLRLLAVTEDCAGYGLLAARRP